MIKKFKTYIGLAVIGLLFSVIGLSFAIFQMVRSQDGENIISVGCFRMEFTELSPSVNLNNTYPIPDSEGIKTTPYIFKIKNTCSIDANFYITLDIVDSTTTMNLSAIKVDLTGDAELPPTVLTNLSQNMTIADSENIRSSYILYSGGLNHNSDPLTFSLRLWMNEGATNAEMAKKFEARITIVSVATSGENNYPLLAQLLLKNNGGKTEIEAKPIPDFNLISPADGTSGMYATLDDSGTSYYFRGAHSLNNNVLFGGYQWKVIRIDGTGNIRLIYNGTEADFNLNGTVNTLGSSTMLGLTAFNSINTSSKYIGWTYDSNVSSVIKSYVDNWYSNNLTDEAKANIENAEYCNDRFIYTGDGSNTTYYGPYQRLWDNKTPSLLCQRNEDKILASIALISADEVVFAGGKFANAGVGSDNAEFYLYNNSYYWTISPFGFQGSPLASRILGVISTGRLGQGSVSNTTTLYARPVIALKSTSKCVSGNGSATDPYIVE